MNFSRHRVSNPFDSFAFITFIIMFILTYFFTRQIYHRSVLKSEASKYDFIVRKFKQFLQTNSKSYSWNIFAAIDENSWIICYIQKVTKSILNASTRNGK